MGEVKATTWHLNIQGKLYTIRIPYTHKKIYGCPLQKGDLVYSQLRKEFFPVPESKLNTNIDDYICVIRLK